MPMMNNETLLVVFVALTGTALMVQAIILLALFLTIRKTAKTMQADIEDLRGTVTPIINSSRDFLDRVTPKIESAATDLAELARGLREQGDVIQASTNEILARVQRQTTRLDSMFTAVVDGVDEAGAFVVETVSWPVRQLSALVASAKAFLGVLRTGNREPQSKPAASDQDMFV